MNFEKKLKHSRQERSRKKKRGTPRGTTTHAFGAVFGFMPLDTGGGAVSFFFFRSALLVDVNP